eukprot:764376-Hanusia_phi.AAC.4
MSYVNGSCSTGFLSALLSPSDPTPPSLSRLLQDMILPQSIFQPMTSSTRFLQVKPNSLSVGGTYQFTATATFNGKSSNASVSVSVTPRDLVPYISGIRQVSRAASSS